MPYLFMSIAILSEVIATSFLKASEGFTKPIQSAIVIIGYATSFYFLSLTLKILPVGIVYAIWSGTGIILVSIIAAILYKQIPDTPAVIGIILIIAGVVIIQLFSKSLPH